MITANESLVRILAATDAIWRPCRDAAPAVRGEVARRRLAYRAEGLPWSSEESDPARQRAAQRELADLADAGLVERFASNGSRTTSVRLTAEGEDLARRAARLTPFSEALLDLDLMATLQNHPQAADFAGVRWIPETLLTGVEWGRPECGREAGIVQGMLAPLLVAELVQSNCSVQGHGWYALTPAGLDLARQRIADGSAGVMPPKSAEGPLMSYYFARLREEWVRIVGAAQDGIFVGELGEVPMPVAPIRIGSK